MLFTLIQDIKNSLPFHNSLVFIKYPLKQIPYEFHTSFFKLLFSFLCSYKALWFARECFIEIRRLVTKPTIAQYQQMSQLSGRYSCLVFGRS
jgi:hypothetical protein